MVTYNFIIRLLLITPVLLFQLPFHIAAQDNLDTTTIWKPYYGIPGADTGSSHKISNCTFFVYDDYMIVEEELKGGEIGSNIFVKARIGKAFPEVNCDKVMRNCDMKVLNEWAEFFLAKRDNFLFILSESGLQKKLIIYDIRSKQKTFESNFSEPAYFNTAGELYFWLETGRANPDNCPKYNKLARAGLDPVIETKVTFNLETQDLSYSSDTRCNYKE